MSNEDKANLRGPVATVIATAAATIAIGVTTAALAGYLVPGRDRDATIAAQPNEPTVTEAPTASPAVAPIVVLVPVAPDGRGGPDAAPTPQEEPRVVFAADFETHEDDDDDHHRRKHHERDDEDEDDHDRDD